MKYEVKTAGYGDLEEISEIEKATMGNYTYVDTAWNYFQESKGDFLCAYDGDKMVGIAHLAILPDGCGWFEALRVHPEHQNQGVGKALYEKAIDLAENTYHTPVLSMYTGPGNRRSAGLAERYGLTNTHDFREYSYQIRERKDSGSFRYIDWKQAEKDILPLEKKYNGYVSLNRTMYMFDRKNICALADEGFFYRDDEGNLIGVGSRFQHGNKLFIFMIHGDYRKAIDFAVNLAAAKNIPTVTCTFASDNEELENALRNYGFEFGCDLITKERIF